MKYIIIFNILIFLCKQAFSNGTDLLPGCIKKGQSIPAKIEDHPHHVSILNEPSTSNFTCGGSILDQNWVISLMACIGDNMTVYVGSNVTHGGTPHRVERKEQCSELLLLKLQTSIIFGPSVKSVEITFLSNRFTGTHSATVTGYGLFTKDGDYVDALRKTEMSITANLKCDHTFSVGYKPLSKCTYNDCDPRLCRGDMGSGIVSNGLLIGVAISEVGCIDLCNTGYYISIIPIALDIMQTMAMPPEQN